MSTAAAAVAITRSPALSHSTMSRGFVHSGVEYSGWAWSTYSRAPLVRIRLASPISSSVSWLGSADPRLRSNPRASRSGLSSSKSHRARRERWLVDAYALTSCDDVSMGLAEGGPSTWIPNSVSVPMIRRTVMHAAYGAGKTGPQGRNPAGPDYSCSLLRRV